MLAERGLWEKNNTVHTHMKQFQQYCKTYLLSQQNKQQRHNNRIIIRMINMIKIHNNTLFLPPVSSLCLTVVPCDFGDWVVFGDGGGGCGACGTGSGGGGTGPGGGGGGLSIGFPDGRSGTLDSGGILLPPVTISGAMSPCERGQYR